MQEPTHVDEWLDAPTADETELPAKMWLEKFRAPAHKKDTAWLAAHILRCKFQNRTYVVVGCSRMGDVWLAQGRANAKETPDSYELRVSIADCSGWSMQLTSSDFIDIDGPWRISNDVGVCGAICPMIVDCCNHPLFALHKDGHPLNRLNVSAEVMERIVADHNARLVTFVSPFASEFEDEEVAPTDHEKYLMDLERWERIAADTKKTIGFDKHSGWWFWNDRSDIVMGAHHPGFPTRVEALIAAIEPYLEEND